jgi:hypothetical protein
MRKLWSYFISAMLTAMLGAFSGAVLAGPGNPVLAATATTAFGQDPVQQSDPKTPPDCKKYPKDPRCKK